MEKSRPGRGKPKRVLYVGATIGLERILWHLRIARAHCKKNWLFLVEIEVIQIFIHVLQEKGMKAVPQRLQGPHSSGLSRPQLKLRVATFVTKIK